MPVFTKPSAPQNERSAKIRSWIVAAAIGLTIAVMVASFALRLGAEAGAQTAERLNLVFGEVLALPETERALLASLAMACRLHVKDKTPGAVVACLRDGAADPSLMLPIGASEPSIALDHLLAKASRIH
jgi:hypothetical protein